MKLPQKIAIIGVGFMGGSLAMSLKRKFPRVSIWGYARSNKSYFKLKKLHIVDKVERDLQSLVTDADLVVLATPVYVIVDYMRKIAPFLKRGAIVLDLGSSKNLIEVSAHKILPSRVHFVGCHPLCGSEKSGAAFSRQDLFKGSLCIITSPATKKSTQTVKKIWERLGCRVAFSSPEFHDKVLSCVSHLPHLISFSLTQLAPTDYLKFSSFSWKDLTRISNSPPSVWADIFLSNSQHLIRDIDKLIKIIKKFRRLIKAKDKKKIYSLIKKINSKSKIMFNC
jgi:prephenate dehydrogenase